MNLSKIKESVRSVAPNKPSLITSSPITRDKIKENRIKIELLLNSTNREGIDKVLDYLDKNNFYDMPSSLNRHHNWEGGLAEHCLGVYDRLSITGEKLPRDSKIITAILHDICKVRKIYKNKNGKWMERKEEELYYPGHGLRSVKVLEKLGLDLTSEERRAIRWHMGGWKIHEKPHQVIRDFYATKKSELWRQLYNADRYDAGHNAKERHNPR